MRDDACLDKSTGFAAGTLLTNYAFGSSGSSSGRLAAMFCMTFRVWLWAGGVGPHFPLCHLFCFVLCMRALMQLYLPECCKNSLDQRYLVAQKGCRHLQSWHSATEKP